MTRRVIAAALLSATALLLAGYSLGRASASRPAPIPAIPESAWTQLGVPEPERAVESVRPAVHDPALAGIPSPAPTEHANSSAPGHSLTGIASWYDNGPGLYAAAGPGLRAVLGSHWRGRTVLVCLSRCISVQLSDWCQCYGTRVIDLSPDAFRALAPLSRGLIQVTVRR